MKESSVSKMVSSYLFLFCGCVRVSAGTYAHWVGVSDQRGWSTVPELERQGVINHPM